MQDTQYKFAIHHTLIVRIGMKLLILLIMLIKFLVSHRHSISK